MAYPPNPGIQIPGYKPDYGNLLHNDPGYMATHSSLDFGLQQAAAQRDAALKSLKYGYNDPSNRFATLNDLRYGHNLDNQDINRQAFLGHNQLAARGALHSGELPWLQDATKRALTASNYGYDRNVYGAGRDYEQGVAGANNAYLGVQQDASSQEAQALMDAANRMAADPLHQPVEGYAHLLDSWEQYGQPVYQDINGNMYDQNGNPLSGYFPGSQGPQQGGYSDTYPIHGQRFI